MTIDEIIRAVQQKDGLLVDGKAGPNTWLAIYRNYFPVSALLPVGEEGAISPVDERSETAIRTLHPIVRPMARALVHAAAAQDITIKVTSGSRTYEEQNALYAQGRTKPGDIVTNARGGQSWHNFSVAFDTTIFNGAKPVYESPIYKVVGSLGKAIGLEWGGSWTNLVDEPHFQFNPNKVSLAEARKLNNEGKTIFA